MAQLILNFMHMGVGNAGGWRHQSAPNSAVELTPEFPIATAKIAERGKFHMMFLTDVLSLARRQAIQPLHNLEPFITVATISQHTKRIGLGMTASTTFYEPYNLARLLNTLDHVSGGRLAWNIVTTTDDAAARNFGLDRLPDHDERYLHAADMVDTVLHLLRDTAWSNEALIRDKSTGVYLDLDRIDFEPFKAGKYSVGGPLNLPRSPQGVPVLLQAGSSPAGIAFAGKYAELVFTSQNELEGARAFRKDVRLAAQAAHRNPDEVRILPGLIPYVGATETEAQKLYNELQEFVDLRETASMLRVYTGLDFSHYGADEVIPPLPEPKSVGFQARYARYKQLIDNGVNTLRKLRSASVRGHRILIGAPEQIAHGMKDWLDAGATDGYTVHPPVVPALLEDFVDQVVPELQRLGVYHHDYNENAKTFRDLISSID